VFLAVAQQVHDAIIPLDELDGVRPLVARDREDALHEKGLHRQAIPPLQRFQPQSSPPAFTPSAYTAVRHLFAAIPHGEGLSAGAMAGERGHNKQRNNPDTSGMPEFRQSASALAKKFPNSFPKTPKAPKH